MIVSWNIVLVLLNQTQCEINWWMYAKFVLIALNKLEDSWSEYERP